MRYLETLILVGNTTENARAKNQNKKEFVWAADFGAQLGKIFLQFSLEIAIRSRKTWCHFVPYKISIILSF